MALTYENSEDLERRLRMLSELLPDLIQVKEGTDRDLFLLLPHGAIPNERLLASIEEFKGRKRR